MVAGLLIGGLFDAIVRYLIPLSIVAAGGLAWFGLGRPLDWRFICGGAAALAFPWIAVLLLSAAMNRSAVEVVRHSDTFDRPEPWISLVAVGVYWVTVTGRWLSLRGDSIERSE